MPVVGGKSYPYTKKGIAAAARARQRTTQRTRRKRGPATRAARPRRMPGIGRYAA
jgi:hypothetical protein